MSQREEEEEEILRSACVREAKIDPDEKMSARAHVFARAEIVFYISPDSSSRVDAR